MCHCSPTSPHILFISGATVSPSHAVPAPVHPYTSIVVPPSASPVTCPHEGGVALEASTCLDRGARRSHYLQLSIFHLVSFNRFPRDSSKKRFDKDMFGCYSWSCSQSDTKHHLKLGRIVSYWIINWKNKLARLKNCAYSIFLTRAQPEPDQERS
jgi:hypothetical protein